MLKGWCQQGDGLSLTGYPALFVDMTPVGSVLNLDLGGGQGLGDSGEQEGGEEERKQREENGKMLPNIYWLLGSWSSYSFNKNFKSFETKLPIDGVSLGTYYVSVRDKLFHMYNKTCTFLHFKTR